MAHVDKEELKILQGAIRNREVKKPEDNFVKNRKLVEAIVSKCDIPEYRDNDDGTGLCIFSADGYTVEINYLSEGDMVKIYRHTGWTLKNSEGEMIDSASFSYDQFSPKARDTMLQLLERASAERPSPGSITSKDISAPKRVEKDN